jgi:hypothetical protein
MADISVTKAILDETATRMEAWLERLKQAADRWPEDTPDLRFGKAPDVSGALTVLIKFTAAVAAGVDEARMGSLFNQSTAAKRRDRLRGQSTARKSRASK